MKEKMEQDKNKNVSFESRQTTETEQAPFAAKQEETQSAHESARQEREESLDRARRKKEVCEAYDALCRLLDERKIIFGDVKAITLRKIDGEKCQLESFIAYMRYKDNSEWVGKLLCKLTEVTEPEDDEFAIEI